MLVYQIDENGIYVKDVMIDSLDDIPSDCVATKPPTETQGFWRPKWTDTAWVEDMSQEDIDALNNVPRPPTAEERIVLLQHAVDFILMNF